MNPRALELLGECIEKPDREEDIASDKAKIRITFTFVAKILDRSCTITTLNGETITYEDNMYYIDCIVGFDMDTPHPRDSNGKKGAIPIVYLERTESFEILGLTMKKFSDMTIFINLPRSDTRVNGRVRLEGWKFFTDNGDTKKKIISFTREIREEIKHLHKFRYYTKVIDSEYGVDQKLHVIAYIIGFYGKKLVALVWNKNEFVFFDSNTDDVRFFKDIKDKKANPSGTTEDSHGTSASASADATYAGPEVFKADESSLGAFCRLTSCVEDVASFCDSLSERSLSVHRKKNVKSTTNSSRGKVHRRSEERLSLDRRFDNDNNDMDWDHRKQLIITQEDANEISEF